MSRGVSQGAGSLRAMRLTAEQQAAVSDEGRRVRIVGGAGTGKTTVLAARYQALAARHPTSHLLVLCRDREAARRFRDGLLPRLAGGFDALPVTTPAGLAHDLVARHGGGDPPRLLVGGRHRVRVRRLLATEDPSGWARLGAYLHRPAFADAVAAHVLEARARGGPDDTWPPELVGFLDRYRAALDHEGVTDGPGLLERATTLAPGAAGRFAHVLVDDHEGATAVTDRLVRALTTGPGAAGLTVAGNPAAAFGADRGADASHLHAIAVDAEHRLTAPFRRPPAPPELVVCGHPATEAEAVVAELGAARAQGAAWSDLAVLLRSPGRRAGAVRRALSRHGIPCRAPRAADVVEEPLAAAVLDVLRWVAGDERAPERLLASPLSGLGPLQVRAVQHEARTTGQPVHSHALLAPLVALRDHVAARRAAGDTAADLAYEVWARALAGGPAGAGPGRGTERGTDGLVALVDGLAAHEAAAPGASLADALAALDEGDAEPAWWRADAAREAGVTVTSIGAAAGDEWHTVVLAGCVEGDLPRLDARRALLRRAGPEDRTQRLAEERRLFGVATSRATHRTVAVAAPQPGVLVSRFVEGWPRRSPAPLRAPGGVAAFPPPTAGTAPVWPTGELVLSATQLDTYADCPLRYAYQYVLRARGEAGVHADLGSLVHEVLAEFCAPGGGRPRTYAALKALAAERWRDDIARFRPQVEEARRDYYDMLDRWWHAEGDPAGGDGPEVVRTEHRFDVAVGPHRLSGAIDRVDRLPDGSLRVVDYKTGKREPSDAEVAGNLQLALYHLAAHRDPDLAALGPATATRLLYVRSMRTYDVAVANSAAHVAATEERVLAAGADILAERFEPSVDATCRHCDFHRLCPLQPEGRHVGGAG